MALTLLSGGMGNPDDETHRKRQGFWLRMAREAKGINQQGAADLLGLKTKSAISDYENGVTEVPQSRLRRLADLYGWPLVIFTEPEPTAEEQAQERMAALARAAIQLAHEDLELEAGDAQGAAVLPVEQPHRQSA